MEISMAGMLNIKTIILSAFATITPEDCKGWILNNIYTQNWFIYKSFLLHIAYIAIAS